MLDSHAWFLIRGFLIFLVFTLREYRADLNDIIGVASFPTLVGALFVWAAIEIVFSFFHVRSS